MKMAARLIAALSNAECYPHPAHDVVTLETHISWVLLAGDFAYKIKKPVELGFLDFSTLEKRRHCCEEELRLNRRLAPQLYLDVVEIRGSQDAPRIAGDGPLLEYAVRMRRFAQDTLASRMLADGRLDAKLIDALAVRLANFHAGLPPAMRDAPFGKAQAQLKSALQNFTQIAPMLSDARDAEALQALRDWTELEYLFHYQNLEERRAAGMVRECHGDLHLNNVVLLDGELVPFDCIEFNAELRWIDVMSEIAFLVMDLMDRGAKPLAWRFLNGYLEATGVYSSLSVLRFYLVYRALVRAKVHLIRSREPGIGAAESQRLERAYRHYVALARDCTDVGRPAILLMHGLAGCGKSTLASQLAQTLGAIRIRADVERKRLHGLSAAARTRSGIASGLYGQDATHATYQRLAEAARVVAASGFTAIVDAAFLLRSQRTGLREAAANAGVPIAVVHVTAPESVLRARITRRAVEALDASEAVVQVLDHQIATAEKIGDEEKLPVFSLDGCKALGEADAHALDGFVRRALTSIKSAAREAAYDAPVGTRSHGEVSSC